MIAPTSCHAIRFLRAVIDKPRLVPHRLAIDRQLHVHLEDVVPASMIGDYPVR